MGIDPFRNADDALVEHFWQLDMAGENVGAVLVADAKSILKAISDHKEGAIALPF